MEEVTRKKISIYGLKPNFETGCTNPSLKARVVKSKFISMGFSPFLATVKILIPALLCSSFLSAQSYVPEKTNVKVKVNPVAHVGAYAFNLKDVKLLNSP